MSRDLDSIGPIILLEVIGVSQLSYVQQTEVHIKTCIGPGPGPGPVLDTCVSSSPLKKFIAMMPYETIEI